MKKNILWGTMLLIAASIGFTSCSDDDDNNFTPPVIAPTGAYILNQGSYTNNAGALYYYNMDTKKSYEAFQSVNGIGLGDTGQDMIVYGSKMYIAVYGSGLIYVTDKNAKVLATIKDEENKLQPRSFDTYNGKVYVTLFDGYLARIDTTTMAIDKRIEVGPNPEGVKAVNNKIYVANSGGMNWQNGYNNTVSVVNPELTSKKDIEVAMNPCELKTDKYNNLYLVSRGDNYGGIPTYLQQINTSTDAVTTLAEGYSYSIFPDGDKIHLLKKSWIENKTESSFTYYDILNKKIVEESFITDGTVIEDINTVSIEPTSGNYYVSVANGSNNGSVYIFSTEGKLLSKFDAGSAFPTGVWFINK